ncbi:dimethylarginine dimethylaminohydrolase family protein [Leptobacterium sp. I13]|uniref:dimethylarginine dimethylaminohydrolase family protein n=1 Tax=Leptobacterium meishanense TaxID=3128904 RepID=UPI0030EDC16C
MLQLNVKNEIAPLKAVVLGTAISNGPTPKAEDAYDPTSLEHIMAGTYPVEKDMVKEMAVLENVFKKYNIKVFRPEIIKDCNQIFARDIAFVIDDFFIKSNILPDRDQELKAIQYIIDEISPDKVIKPPKNVHVEGGDVMPWNNYIFVGTYTGVDYPSYITARTNKAAVHFLQELFPEKKVKSFELRKSNTNPKENALHLDCCFQPIGKDKAIICKAGFLLEEDYEWLYNYFGKENMFEITADEMARMFCNVFSITPNVVISEQKFTRLNNWLRNNGFTVEKVPYSEISKQGGLLRCSTMPLIREG